MPRVRTVQAARAYLRRKKVSFKVVPPRKLASAKEETGKEFPELLRMIARLMMQGQGVGQAPRATRIALVEASQGRVSE